MPARSSAATTRSNAATLDTGPMRTRYILRPAIRSSRTKILPKPPPRNFSASRCAFAGSENAPACTNSAGLTAAAPEAFGATAPGAAEAGCAAPVGTVVVGAAAAGTTAANTPVGAPGAGGATDAVITGGGADGSMVRTSTMAVPLRNMSSLAAAV